MQYTNIENILELNTLSCHQKEEIISLFKRRFLSYGYQQIKTAIFEPYDLYANVNGTIKTEDMIKVIDSQGKVLVLRPDVTIPITRMLANDCPQLNYEKRFFYVQDVFRSSFNDGTNHKRTQAGVEYFGNYSLEADAEVLNLAIEILLDLKIKHFTIEIGHAGFVHELFTQLSLTSFEISQLKQLIQAKNVADLELFLEKLQIKPTLRKSILEIPFLYGKPEQVMIRAKEIASTPKMKEALKKLEEVVDLLDKTSVQQYITLDFGLINHMDYYSDIIFQGFIEKVGRPILMGGRYDRLSSNFKANMPAIGFAYDVDVILDNLPPPTSESRIDVQIYYDEARTKDALKIAQQFRSFQYRTVMYKQNPEVKATSARYTVQLEKEKNLFIYEKQKIPFTNIDDLKQIIRRLKEEQQLTC